MSYGSDLATFLSSDYRFSLDGTLVGEAVIQSVRCCIGLIQTTVRNP
jgi:hypothetical protein